MIDYTKNFTATSQRTIDTGLREYMLSIYNYMAVALAITGIAAFATMNVEPVARLMFQIHPTTGHLVGYTGIGMLIAFSPLLIGFYFFSSASSMEVEKAKIMLWVYAGLTGMSLASLGYIYTGTSITRTFFICASLFGAMSIYGHTTKKDLTSMGSFLVMGLIGLILASLANIFIQSSALYWATSLIGVGIFMGMTAWDMQRLKMIYYQVGGGEMGKRMAVVGAFTLYLDFINLFIYLLRFFGNRRD